MEGKHDSTEVFETNPTDLERYYQNRVESFEKDRIDVDERLARISETQDAVHKVRSSKLKRQCIPEFSYLCARHDGTYA